MTHGHVASFDQGKTETLKLPVIAIAKNKLHTSKIDQTSYKSEGRHDKTIQLGMNCVKDETKCVNN